VLLTVVPVGENASPDSLLLEPRRPLVDAESGLARDALLPMPLKGPIGEPTGPSANELGEPSRLASTRGREGGRRDEQPGARETSSDPGNSARIDGRKLQPGSRVACDLR
jgi:hypothetical protein